MYKFKYKGTIQKCLYYFFSRIITSSHFYRHPDKLNLKVKEKKITLDPFLCRSDIVRFSDPTLSIYNSSVNLRPLTIYHGICFFQCPVPVNFAEVGSLICKTLSRAWCNSEQIIRLSEERKNFRMKIIFRIKPYRFRSSQ